MDVLFLFCKTRPEHKEICETKPTAAQADTERVSVGSASSAGYEVKRVLFCASREQRYRYGVAVLFYGRKK